VIDAYEEAGNVKDARKILGISYGRMEAFTKDLSERKLIKLKRAPTQRKTK